MDKRRAIALLSNEVRETLEADSTGAELPFVKEQRGSVLFVDISGFTKISKKLRKEEVDHGIAADKLSSQIIGVIGKLTDICYDWGGDVIKFAGDALLCTWKVTETRDIQTSLSLARRTAYEMMVAVEKGDKNLKLHGGIASGSLLYIHLGKGDLRWHLVAGSACVRASAYLNESKKGEILYSLHPENENSYSNELELVENRVKFFDKSDLNGKITTKTVITDGDYFAQVTPDSTASRDLSDWEEVLSWDGIKSYLPTELRYKIEGGTVDNGEIASSISTMFVSLDHLMLDSQELKNNRIGSKKFRSLNQAFMALTKIVQFYHGEVRDLLFDDKGCVFIAVFGAYSGEEMAELRCVRAADYISRGLPEPKIGITIGPCYTGVCGNDNRIDYIVMGHDVNQAARYMGGANPGQILVSHEVMAATQELMGYEPVVFKLKDETFTAYELTGEILRSGTFIANFRSKTLPRKKKGQDRSTDSGRITDVNDHEYNPNVKHEKFVGRKLELDSILNKIYRDNSENTKAAILLHGKEGFGKSYIVEQVRQAVQSDTSIHFAASFFLEENTVFFVARQLLYSFLGLGKEKLELNNVKRRGSVDRSGSSIRRIKSNANHDGRGKKNIRRVRTRGNHDKEQIKELHPIEKQLKRLNIEYNGHVMKYFLPEVMSLMNKNNNRTDLLRKNNAFRMNETMKGVSIKKELSEREMKSTTKFFIDVIKSKLGENENHLILIEDLQWIDLPSLQLLNKIITSEELPGVTFMLTTRPVQSEQRRKLKFPKKNKALERLVSILSREGQKKYLTVNLSTFSESESEQLTRNILVRKLKESRKQKPGKKNKKKKRDPHVDQEVSDAVFERCEGHPLHLSELVKWMVHNELVILRDERYQFSDAPGINAKRKTMTHVPESLARIIRYHVSELPGAPNRVLKVASALGKQFSFQLLQDVLRLDTEFDYTTDEDLHDHLRILQTGGLIEHVNNAKMKGMTGRTMLNPEIKYRIARLMSTGSGNIFQFNWKFQDDITQEVVQKSIPQERMANLEDKKNMIIMIEQKKKNKPFDYTA